VALAEVAAARVVRVAVEQAAPVEPVEQPVVEVVEVEQASPALV
jgi:hypothetical protein